MTTTPTRRTPTARTRSTDSSRTKSGKPERDPKEYLDPLTLSRKEGWKAMAEAPKPQPPESLSLKEIRKLDDGARAAYNEARRRWHGHMGIILSAECQSVLEQLDTFVQPHIDIDDPAGTPMVALSGLPGLGKTTITSYFGRSIHLQQIAQYGPLTPSGDERTPVCRIGLTGNTGIKELNIAASDYFAHPASHGVSAPQHLRNALDCVISCQTKLLIIDDLHFLHGRTSKITELSDHFKHIADTLHVIVLFVGIGLHEPYGLLDDNGDNIDVHKMDQLLRCTKPVDMKPFDCQTDADCQHWHEVLLTVEQQLILALKFPGMLAEDMSDYLFARSTGHMGSLMNLLRQGCYIAIKSGTERLSIELLNGIRIDSAAELGRRQLETAFRTGNMSTRGPRKPKR